MLSAPTNPESALIRELVHSGLQRERYRQAANDPAIRELLRTFSEMLTDQLGPMEERITHQMAVESDVAALYFQKLLPFIMFTGRALLARFAGGEPQATAEAVKAFYAEMAQKAMEEVRAVAEDIFHQREELMAPPSPDEES